MEQVRRPLAAGEPQHEDLKSQIEGFAAASLDIPVRKLRNKSQKTWRALGGDSLTAVNFMGACYEAGIQVHIPDILQSTSVEDLINRIIKSHLSAQSISDEATENSYGPPAASLLDGMRDVLRGPFDEIQAIGPCSPMQENFIALQNIDHRAYQLQLSITLASTKPEIEVTVDTVTKSWTEVVQKHAALRTMFVDSVDRPGHLDQIIWRSIKPEISVLPFSAAQADISIGKYGSEFPHRMVLAPSSGNKVFIRLIISHAIVDAVSISNIFRDLFRALTNTLPAGEYMQCSDFIHAQQPDSSQEASSYWSDYISTTEGSFLSSEGSSKAPKSLYQVNQLMPIPPEWIENLSDQSNATLVNACQLAYALVLRSYTGTSNVCFSYTASGRQKRIKGLQDAVGNFVNTLPCCVNIDANTTVSEALERTQNDYLNSLPHQGASLNGNQGARGISVRQLGDSLLSFQRGVPEAEIADAGFDLDVLSWEAPSDYNYTLAISLEKEQIGLRLSVWESLTSHEDAANIMQLFQDSLSFVLQNPNKRCTEFQGITARDQEVILARNREPYALTRNCVHDQVQAMAERQPDASAISAWDGDLTYSQLQELSRRLASELVKRGVNLEQRVGICMDKSRWAPLVMLAILIAGGVVVPLGNQHPPNHIRDITANADISLVLTDRFHGSRLEGVVPCTVVVDADYLEQLPCPSVPDLPTVSPDNAAWIVHTSGSTGLPKAVVLEHKTLCSPMRVQADVYEIGSSTRALQFSAHTFDVVVKDIFTTLSYGGCVCIPSESQRLNDLGDFIQSMGINMATLTPTVTSLLNPSEVPSLKTIVMTGEAPKSVIIQKWLDQGRVKLFNGYGPCECSHVSTINGPMPDPNEASTIGFPAANRLWVTDPLDVNRLSPIGAVGELLIEGAIAREYLNDTDRTAAAFVVDPSFVQRCGLTPGRRMYRTGDLVRQNMAGSMTYLGRRDTQIKIRGQRVEVGDIESRISQSLPGKPLVCVDYLELRNDASRARMLIAAIVMNDEPAMVEDSPQVGSICKTSENLRKTLEGLHSQLSDQLPLYMIPAHFVPFASLPTNASAKLDRRATRALLHSLSEKDLALFKNQDVSGTISTGTEKRLQALWAEVLQRSVQEIGSQGHFLHLGGDSVLAMRMSAIARKRSLPLSVADIMQHPRLSDMAQVVDGYDQEAAEMAKKDPRAFELWNGYLSAAPEQQEILLGQLADQCGVGSAAIEDVYPTSPLQEGLMAMTMQSPETYVAQHAYRLNAKVDLHHFQSSWAEVVKLLPILRTRIVYSPDSGFVQVVTRDVPQWAIASDMGAYIKADREASFVYGSPLHRFALIEDGSRSVPEKMERYFVWTAHHSAYDGQTVTKTLKMLSQALLGLECETATPIPRFIRHLEQTMGNEGREQTEAYWRGQLENAQLSQFPKLPGSSYQPVANSVLKHKMAQKQNLRSQAGRVSTAILLRAAWSLVLASRTGNDEIITAVVLSGRDMPLFGIEDLVAPTITTVPCKIPINRDVTIADFLTSLDSQNKDMAPYTHFGLANIRRAVPSLGHDFDPGHLFLVQPNSVDMSTLEELGLERLTGDRGNFEGYGLVVECTLDATGGGTEVELRFDENILPISEAKAIVAQLEYVSNELELYNLTDDALGKEKRSTVVSDLDLISPEDKEALLCWNGPLSSAAQTTLVEFVERQLANNPSAPAVCARDGQLTYSQLDVAACRLARYLVSLGVSPGARVGLCMDKSKFAIISMLAILKMRAAVVPLGVQYSESRIKSIVDDANVSVAVVDLMQAKRFNALVQTPVLVNAGLVESLATNGPLEEAGPRPSDVAWVVYTSGSTGTPKGVVLEHQALCTGILAQGARYGVTSATRALQFSAFTFDISIHDVFTTLAFGGCVCVPSETDRTDGLATFMNDMQVTFAILTPTVVSFLIPESVPKSFKTVVLAGEAVTPAVVKPWFGQVSIFNGYGPAECSIFSAINGPITRPEDAPVIGSPVSNRLWVVNPSDHNSLVPIGASGELLVEGPLLARGYLHDEEKTKRSFVVDPNFASSLHLQNGRRMYRTGDLVRQNRETGLLEYLGRIDTQIKIRGQRVEIGEIESQIVYLRPDIHNVCVDLVSPQQGSEKLLLAAVELSSAFEHDDDASADSAASTSLLNSLNFGLEKLRQQLLQVLPLYMVPTHFIPMSLPVNASGKLDRRSTRVELENLTLEQLKGFAANSNATMEDRPLSATEGQLRQLWAQVLGLSAEDIGGANSDFFQLGGDSVAAMRLVAAAQAATKPLQLGVAQILRNPRLSDMAEMSDEYNVMTERAAEADPEPFELWSGFAGISAEAQRERLYALAEQCEDVSGPEDIIDVYPATSLQEGLMAITSKQTGAYVAQQIFKLKETVDVSRLQQAWQILSDNLSILRTRIVYTAQGPVQVVVNKTSSWTFVNDLQSYLLHDESEPFTYGKPLHRLAIAQKGTSRYFVWTAHHAAYDGWSLQLVLRMLVSAYQEHRENFITTPVSRFIRYLNHTDDNATAAYWRSQLENAQLTKFPPLPSSTYQPHAASLLRSKLNGLSEKVRTNRSKSERNTPAVPLGTLLRAAWATTAATYAGADEAIINIALSGRDVPVDDIANIVAPTITTVPVRILLNRDQSVHDFLTAVDQQAKDMVPFAHAGLHRIRNAVPGLGSDFDAGHLFIIQPAQSDDHNSGLEAIGLELDIAAIAESTERRDFGGYALAVDCTVSSESVEIELRYDSNVLPDERATALLSHFEHTIRQLETSDADTTLADLDLFSPADSNTIRKWNENTQPAMQECIHHLIQKTVERKPGAQAVKAWDGELSYASLYATCRRLAHQLRNNCGVGPEVKVGLCMDKSVWAVVSILSILMAGGAVVPLGIQQPLARITTIVSDSEINTIMVDETHATRLNDLRCEGKCLLTVDAALLEELPLAPLSTDPICPNSSPDDAAWVVYTSGSTGVPKGIVLEHKALCSSFRAHGPRVGFCDDTRALQFSAYTFDNCIEDILSVLRYGGCVCVPSEYQRLNSLTDTIREFNVNLVNTTPTVATLIQPTDVPMLKTLLLGGESVFPAVVEQWLGHAKIINTYGPAECCVDVACSTPMENPNDAYTIGHALGVSFWVTSPSNYNRLVPIGIPGELLIEGSHLGRGYLNDPEKTAKAFVWDPDFVHQLGFSPGRRMYRTGDLVRQNADGSLVHLGRIDTQIKIRGQRVETGEIESNILRVQPEVKIACVDLIKPRNVSGDPMLIAAIDVGDFGRDHQDDEETDLAPQQVRRPTEALSAMIRNLRAELLMTLPRYMVPQFVPMTSLPLNASSKLDRRAARTVLESLNREELVEFGRPAESSESRELSPMEDKLRHIWVEVLACSPSIGAHDHFIQLGGDSVTAMRLVAAAQAVGIRIGVADILQNPRLSDLARVAENYNAIRATENQIAPFELWKGFADSDDIERASVLSKMAERCGVTTSRIEDVYPATALQEGLMAVTAHQPGAYVAQNIFKLQNTNVQRLKEAWSKLTNHLTILRTRIVYDADRSASVQVVIRGDLEWVHVDNLQTYLAKDKSLPFAYGTPLNRLAIVEPPADSVDSSSYFVWTQHHSGYDGYQNGLALNTLAQIYHSGEDLHDHVPPVTRFINYLQQMDKAQVASYWKQQLGGVHLTRFPPLPHHSYLPDADSTSTKRMTRGKTNATTPIPILLRAAWAVTVAAYTGSDEATSTVALSGRDIPVLDIGNMLVPTLTTVPVRTCMTNRQQSVSDFLASMVRQSEEMKPFLHSGMQHIRAAVPGLGVDFDPGHLLIVQPPLGDGDEDPLLMLGFEDVANKKSDFGGYALAVQCTINTDQTIDVELLYDSHMLSRPVAEALLLQFEHILHQLETRGDATIADIDLFTKADMEKVQKWNRPVLHAMPTQACIHDLVQNMVDKQPHAQAVTAWDGDMTYIELCQTSYRLAHHLGNLGVGPEVAVGVCMDKSLWAMMSMLAILQAGGVVVALGTQHPLSRIKTIIADADIMVTLVDQSQARRLHGASQMVIVDQSLIEQLPAQTMGPVTGVRPDNGAWIVYTSGSTGLPKGVVLEHQALCTGMIGHGTLFGNNTNTRALQFASHTFGVVMEDMFTTLVFGGCTCIPSEDQRMDIVQLTEAIRKMHINFVNLTSTAASLLDPREVPEIKTVVLGGEAVRPAVVEQWEKHAEILNAYGQSECSVESVISRVENGMGAMNIGYPIAGCAAWVVDASDYNRLVPVGTPGELLIQGPLLARGYLNDAEKTADAFLSQPKFLSQLGFSAACGDRMYRTGDLVQQNEDGSLVYLGRRDAQIKIRGQRVEPGEIESRIVQFLPEISHSFVDLIQPHDAATSDPVLVAAVELQITDDTEHQTPSQSLVRSPTTALVEMVQKLRSSLTQDLPSYMVPNFIVPILNHLPVNASGKLDRRAARTVLQTLSRHQLGAFSKSEKKFERALTPTEEKLRLAYAEVLGRDPDDIGPNEHFVQLGGDSVAAMHVVAACRHRGLTVSVRDLLQKQSIVALASEVLEIEDNYDSEQGLDESSAVTNVQEWMLNYHVARPDVGMTYFALDALKPLDGERMADACRKLISSVEVLHTGFVLEDGEWKRIVLSPFTPHVPTYETDLPIEDWTESYIQREGFKPIEYGQPIAEMAICSTSTQHRVLLRISHAIWDGMCIAKFWSTLKDLYETGETKRLASFSQYMAQVEKHRTTEATTYWTKLLKNAEMTPIGHCSPKADEYVWPAGVIGPTPIEVGQNLPPGTTYANVLKAAWSLVLARHAKRDDVVFADLVSGRAGVDSSTADALGCCSTPMPVRIRIDPSWTYADLVYAVKQQQLDSIPYETYGFDRIVQQCTDWPSQTAATSWINHVPKRIGGSKVDIDGTEYNISQPKQEEQKWTFSEMRISWSQIDSSLEFTMAYAVGKVSVQAAQRMHQELVATLEKIIAAPNAPIGL